MEEISQQPMPAHGRPPPFSPTTQPRSYDAKSDMMEVETNRSQRAASVLSGLSADDIEAAETLKSLQQDIHSPRNQHATPPHHVQITSSYNSNEPEPLLSLITSQYPLAASVINGGLSVYKTAQQYTPGGEWTERNVGLPLARTTARISGVETVARWALQPKRENRSGQPLTPDVEKAYIAISPDGVLRRAESDQLPPYSDGDRSPPYSESQLAVSHSSSSRGWRQQLVITTSGLGVAMSDESIRSLKHCLNCLRWANSKLGGAVTTLKELLEEWERKQSTSRSMSVSSLASNDTDTSAISARIAAVKAEVLATLKQVVTVVSTYAGGALPENARRLVHQHLVTLPQRFSIASRRASDEERNDLAATNANRALVLAQEGLDMMNQVTRVVGDTLNSAESWCEKLGRRRAPSEQQPTPTSGKSLQSTANGGDMDVKMEM